MTKINESVVDL